MSTSVILEGSPSQKNCETCCKLKGKECKVLKELIGDRPDSECWAWTNNPNWEKEFQSSRIKYEFIRWKGENQRFKKTV